MNGWRWLPHPLMTLLLTAVWLLLVNSVAPGQVLLGLLLGWAIPLLTADFLAWLPRLRRPGLLCRFVAMALWDIVTANFEVARQVLGRPARLRPGFIEIPLECQDDFIITALASLISLTPGTVSSAVSPDRRRLLVHCLDVDDRAALVAHIKQRYEAPLLEMFECSPP